MTEPIEHIRQIIDRHRQEDRADRASSACRCGAEAPADHAGHVAEEIVNELGLKAEHARDQMRYVSAWLDDELTKLEGAE